MNIEFFFDIGSPYTYLASTQIAGLEARTGASVTWRPFLLGGVFKSVGNVMPANIQGKGAYMLQDLQSWAEHYGVDWNFSPFFPINSLLPMRALAGFGADELPAAAHKVFRSYWVDGQNPSDPATLTALLGADAVARANDDAVKGLLRANTEEAVTRGAFGAPTFFVGDRLFFGNDRLHFVEAAIRGA